MHKGFYKCCFVCFFLCVLSQLSAQQISALDRVEPAFWWTGMKYHSIQLIVHGDNIAQRTPKISYKGVKLLTVHKVENPNYLFLDLDITAVAKPGKFSITFSKSGSSDLDYTYELKPRVGTAKAQGVNSSDFIYLLMPDRFANGDTSNDIVKGMNETSIDRDSMFYRHGGDLQGVINHLDYLQNLGITALWMTPVLENNEVHTSYHGYANTENYQIDRRYGSNELFKVLTDSLHKRGMKMIMDVVPNHFGIHHWTVVDMPMKDWVHQWPAFTNSNYREQTNFDPYAADTDRQIMLNGWFDHHMPDMNQSNPYLEKYIIQSDIWWIEFAGVDGFRIDTYPYNDPQFMANWAEAVKTEYPHFSMFGETLVNGVINQAAFVGGDRIHRGVDTQLPGVTDNTLRIAITDAMTHSFGWDDGINKVYGTLAKDFVYPDPYRNVVFLDNHDMSRFYSVVDQNEDKLKSALAWLLTTRGIPQIYYGTELMFKGFSNPDGLIRQDFPGGWKSDTKDKFTEAGRTEAENDLYNYVARLANYRKENTVLQTGKLMQYIPQDGIYVYFRYNENKTVMVIMNTNSKSWSVNTQRFSQRLKGFSSAVDIATGERMENLGQLEIPAFSTWVLELK